MEVVMHVVYVESIVGLRYVTSRVIKCLIIKIVILSANFARNQVVFTLKSLLDNEVSNLHFA